jgi:hypothetical protein
MSSLYENLKKIDVTYIFAVPYVIDVLLRLIGTSGFLVYIPFAPAIELAGVVCVVIIIAKAIGKIFKKKQ